MKIKPQVILVLSTVLLLVEVARAQTPTASSPPTTPVPPAAPASPVPEAAEMSPEELEALIRQSVRENLENRTVVEERVEVTVDRQVRSTLDAIEMRLSTLLWGLAVAAIGGGIGLWFLRRNTLERALREVEDRTETLKVELERDLATKAVHPIDSRGQTISDPVQLQEMVSMALSVQSIMASARAALEEAVQTQEQFGEQLQELARYQLREAQTLMEAGEYSQAIELYDKAIEMNATDPSLFCDRGAALVQLHRYNEASDAYERATELSPENAEIWYDWARCRALQGSVAQAVANLKQALQLNPQIRERVQSDADFAIVRENEWFQTTVGGERS